jgi:phage terminase small subunit
MPRRSAADIEAASIAPPSYRAALAPPASLSPAARAVFLDLVASHEPEHFEPGDTTLMGQYCEAAALAARSAAKLQEGDATQLKVWERSCSIMSSLSLRLRLGPQSRREKARVGKTMTWSDNFALSRGADGR